MLKFFSFYHLALLKYLLGTRLKNSAFDQSVNTFFNHQSFRFPKKATADYLIVLRIVKWIIFSQFKRERNYRIGINSHNAIFDSNFPEIYSIELGSLSIYLYVSDKDLSYLVWFIHEEVVQELSGINKSVDPVSNNTLNF